MTKQEETIPSNLVKMLQDYENECFRLMEAKLQKLKKLADAMYTAAQDPTTDASPLRKAMEEYNQFIINEL